MDQNNQQNKSAQTTPKSQFKLSQNDYAKMDEKTIATIKASAIWSAVATVITSIAGMVAAYYFVRNFYSGMMGQYGQYLNGYLDQVSRPQMINIGVLISSLISGAIGGAIVGWAIAKFYPTFVEWQKKIIGNKLNSFFKLLFWPSVAGVIISLVMTGALSTLNSGFSAFLIVIVADIAAAYIYAKMMDKAVGKYYK
jgi:hypothetical protein